jgi:tetratricopeptide (TPR) repeat protein
LLQKLVDDRRFAFADLVVVLICGAIGILKPELGFWFLPITLLPWFLRAWAGRFPFQRTMFDGALFVFLITAGVASFIAYDRVAAADKFFFILVSILMYYALCGQPQKNFAAVAVLFSVIGIGVALYYFLTRDYSNHSTGVAAIAGLEIWLMDLRREVDWLPIPTGNVPGLTIITTSFGFYWLMYGKNNARPFVRFAAVIGSAVVLLAILSTQSTSVWVALIGAAGLWILWQLFRRSGLENRAWFAWLVLCYLIPLVFFICSFDAAGSVNRNDFGLNSRPEVFTRAGYFLRDFPISGAGLASFPGLYSTYVLGIPYFYFSNSYNMFLDVAIEQGLLGGSVFLFIYLGSIFQLSGKLQKPETRVQRGLVLFVLVFSFIHALMHDYLYNAAGTALMFFPVAMSVMWGGNSWTQAVSTPRPRRVLAGRRILTIAVVIVAFAGVLLNVNKLGSLWYSNLGAVQLAQVQLTNFPESGWPGVGIIPKLHDAEASFQASRRLDPANLTANHRLGLIYMLYRDFESAARYLETARNEAPSHRGLLKALGYSYLWMGDVEKARSFLVELPESNAELDAYYSWWSAQERADLSNNAYLLRSRLNAVQGEP